MIGQGIMPQSWSPLADNVPAEDIGPFIESLAKSYRARAETLPSHRQFIAAMVGDQVKEPH
jgi:tryptophan halogenase